MPQKKLPGNRYHSTESECDFISNLGSFGEVGQRASRITLLEGYLKGARNRDDWGNMDGLTIIRHAEVLLQTLTGR